MSVREISPRGALGRLTRSAFGKARSLPTQSDMDDSARLSQALDELEALALRVTVLEQAVIRAREDDRWQFVHRYFERHKEADAWRSDGWLQAQLAGDGE
jgi:hypothetical protein